MNRINGWSLVLSGKRRASALILVLMVLVFFALLTTFFLALAQNDVWRREASFDSARWRATTEGAVSWSIANLPDALPENNGHTYFEETLNGVHFTATLQRASQSSPFPVDLLVAMVDPDDDLTRKVRLKGLVFPSSWRLETNRPARFYLKSPEFYTSRKNNPPERLVVAGNETITLPDMKGVLFDLHCHAPDTKIPYALTVQETAIFDGDLILDGSITARRIYVAGHLQFGENGSMTAEHIILGSEPDEELRAHIKGQITIDRPEETSLRYYINPPA